MSKLCVCVYTKSFEEHKDCNKNIKIVVGVFFQLCLFFFYSVVTLGAW